MTKPKAKIDLRPRVVTASQAASRIGRSAGWFASHREKLFEAGFPRPIPLCDGYDLKKIDDWLDNLGTSEHSENLDFDNQWMKACYGKSKNTAPRR